MPGQTVDLAFLGCGAVTASHSKTLRRMGGVRLHYASRDGARAQQYERDFAGAGSYSSYEAALSADAIDAVLVATPPSSHLDLTLAALQAGKHVIVEKPPFLHSSDFDAVAAAAERVGRQVMVAENYFYKPLLRRLREILAADEIGPPLFVHLNALKTQRVDDWRGDLTVAGGGALFEGGIHWVNFAASLGPELRRVVGLRAGTQEGPDRSIMLALDYAGGTVGALYYSWEVPSLFKGLRISRIWGREGSITFESNGLFVLVRGRRKRVLFPGLRDISGYRAMFQDFLAAIRRGSEPEFGLAAARRDLRLIEQAYATDEPGTRLASESEGTET